MSIELQQVLESGAGIEPKRMIKILMKQFSLDLKTATHIYRAWRKKYVRIGYKNVGRALYKFEQDKLLNFAEVYAKRSKKGFTEADIITAINLKRTGMKNMKIAKTVGNGMSDVNVQGILVAARKAGVINSHSDIYKRCV